MSTPKSTIVPAALYILVARRIRQHRIHLGLTQTAAADGARLPLRTYRRFEATGRGNVETLYAVAMALERGRGIENVFPVWQEKPQAAPVSAEAIAREKKIRMILEREKLARESAESVRAHLL